jgi:hypothetical protein
MIMTIFVEKSLYIIHALMKTKRAGQGVRASGMVWIFLNFYFMLHGRRVCDSGFIILPLRIAFHSWENKRHICCDTNNMMLELNNLMWVAQRFLSLSFLWDWTAGWHHACFIGHGWPKLIQVMHWVLLVCFKVSILLSVFKKSTKIFIN